MGDPEQIAESTQVQTQDMLDIDESKEIEPPVEVKPSKALAKSIFAEKKKAAKVAAATKQKEKIENMGTDQEKLSFIFSNSTNSPSEKLMTYTKNYCLPKLLNNKDLKEDLSSISYICYYNGVNILQNTTLIADHANDLLKGYDLKKNHLIEHPFPQNHSECPQAMQQRFGKISTDSLIPEITRYEKSQFINVYSVFCKKRMKSMKQIYSQGLELQHKMHQIESFNTCNDDKAAEIGRTQYCIDMFGKQEFVFWSSAQIKEECQRSGEMTCEKMNDAIFSKYGELEKSTLQEMVRFTDSEIRKKKEKELKLQQFVQQADELNVSESEKPSEPSVPKATTFVQVESKSLEAEACDFLGDYSD